MRNPTKSYVGAYLLPPLIIIIGMFLLVGSFWNIDWFISINFGLIPFHVRILFFGFDLTFQSVYALFWYFVTIGVTLLAFGVAVLIAIKGKKRKILGGMFALIGLFLNFLGYATLLTLIENFRHLANPKPIWISYLDDFYPAWGTHIPWETGMRLFILQGLIGVTLVVIGEVLLAIRTKPRR